MANEDQERAKLSYEIQVYREQLRLLEREIERINLTTVDLANALRTVENIKNDQIMVPIGGGSFIRADVKDTKIFVAVGADYLEESDRAKAEAELKRRMESTKRAFEKLKEQFTIISKRLQDSSMKLGGFSAGARQPGPHTEADNEAYF